MKEQLLINSVKIVSPFVYIYIITEFESEVKTSLHSVIMMLTLDICSHLIVSELKQII